jgi:hypothetical protein
MRSWSGETASIFRRSFFTWLSMVRSETIRWSL